MTAVDERTIYAKLEAMKDIRWVDAIIRADYYSGFDGLMQQQQQQKKPLILISRNMYKLNRKSPEFIAYSVI